jgi:hypothetical protein
MRGFCKNINLKLRQAEFSFAIANYFQERPGLERWNIPCKNSQKFFAALFFKKARSF